MFIRVFMPRKNKPLKKRGSVIGADEENRTLEQFLGKE